MHSYEVEVKSLLGSKKRTEEVRAAMRKVDPACVLKSRNKQLNHYFEPLTSLESARDKELGLGGGNLAQFVDVVAPKFPPEISARLSDLANRAKEFSVRTRRFDKLTASKKDASTSLGTGGEVFLVLKVSVDDTTSANGIVRMEFEEKVPLTLQELDELILSAGFVYQAKWSREREEYLCKGINITLDKNAGYGWVAEFERMVDNPLKVDAAREEIRAFMGQLGVEELPQNRLGRMFAFYNSHWQEYYRTDRIFVIE